MDLGPEPRGVVCELFEVLIQPRQRVQFDAVTPARASVSHSGTDCEARSRLPRVPQTVVSCQRIWSRLAMNCAAAVAWSAMCVLMLSPYGLVA